MRKIIHVDMDAFYASVEQRDNPDLRGKPLAVGGGEKRGVVAAASYEARQYGVRSAMAGTTAFRQCPGLVFVKPRFDVYRSVSQQIHAIFGRYSDVIEPLSLDEAYLDVTEDIAGLGSATAIAQRIRAEIREELSLTASAGVSYNKFIAKLASDENKPDGLCVVRPEQGADFVAMQPVRRFHGVGPRTAERMGALGIHSGSDLRLQSREFLAEHFGKLSEYLYGACRGEDDRPVRSDRQRKSLGAERTYSTDLFHDSELRDALSNVAEIVWERIDRAGVKGRTVTLKIKFADFHQITRSQSLSRTVESKEVLESIGVALLKGIMPVEKGIRLMGLTLSGLDQPETQQEERAVSEVREAIPVQQSLEF